MQTISLDYETEYSKDYSIRDMGAWAYCNDPRFNAYLLAVAWEDGRTWIGNPKDFDWESINGLDWVAANAGFEWEVTERLRKDGVVPAHIKPRKIYDVLDLSRYLGYPGNLNAACQYLLNVKIDKGMRDRAKNQTWVSMSPDFQDAMKQYALLDAVHELSIWQKHGHKMPEDERMLSRLTRIMCRQGVPIDVPAVDDAISKLEAYLADIRSRIPWTTDPTIPVMSPKAMAKECLKKGVAPPTSMAKDSEAFAAWLKEHGDMFPFAVAIGQYRSANNLLKKLQTMKRRTRLDGVMPFGLKYFGGHTGRDSGDSGFNVQNLHREPYTCTPTKGEHFKIDLRGMIAAPTGKLLLIADEVAIEPCVLAVLSEDKELLKRLSTGEDVYEAWARLTKGYADPRPLNDVDPRMRRLCKVEQLGLSYGAGVEKCIKIAKMWAGIDLTYQQAQLQVAKFRERPFIPRFWQKLESLMTRSAGEDFQFELPSGRIMNYRKVQTVNGLSAEIPKLGQMLRCRFWGGAICENIIQSVGRDVFMHHILELQKKGINIICRIHDEVLCLVDEDKAEESLKLALQIMSTPPPWLTNLPIRAAGHLSQKYCK